MNKTSHHAVSVAQFPAKPPLLAVSIHKPRHEGDLKMFSADEDVRHKEVWDDPGIEPSALN